MQLLTTEHTGDGRAIELGGVVFATAIAGANVLRDVREAITNTLGGRMSRYETLVDRTVERALSSLSDKARAAGYDGVLAVRLTHPVITDGAVEVLATGTGFRYRA
ncbi:MAG: YbjQ family protein [Hyphomicrobiaceae bacterium]|jgi:uncharacterized protein YbjQ (UPF0145 family)